MSVQNGVLNLTYELVWNFFLPALNKMHNVNV